MQDRVFKLLLEEDDVTWQTILYNLVKDEGMDPWDIDVSQLTRKYIEAIKQMKEADMRLSGKVVLAAAVLLKMKSTRFVDEDIMELDRLISSTGDMSGEEFYDELENLHGRPQTTDEMRKIIPRTPQPRKRKVSIYDLVNALEQALEVKKRRIIKSIPVTNFEYEGKRADIGLMIRHVYNKILTCFKLGGKQLFYHNLLPQDASREDKVFTFVPLLHLTNERRVDLEQIEHFGDIKIYLKKSTKEAEKELGLG